jgi:hypothetical protein
MTANRLLLTAIAALVLAGAAHLGAEIKRAMTVLRRRSGARRQPSETTHAMMDIANAS